MICMLVAHASPLSNRKLPAWFYSAVEKEINDLASPLFGLVMGGAAALVWSRPAVRTASGALAQTARDVVRAVLVFAIGMWLSTLGTYVAVVLQVLALLMLAAPVLMRLRTPLLAALAVVSFALAPSIVARWAPRVTMRNNGTGTLHQQLVESLISGASYRAVSLLPLFAAGALFVRWGLTSRRTLTTSVGIGLAALVVHITLNLTQVTSASSGDWPDQIHDLAITFTAFGVIALVAYSDELRGRRPAAPWRVLASIGTVALSLYVGHLVLLRPMQHSDFWRGPTWHSILFMTTLIVAPCVLAALWHRHLGKGPVERAVDLLAFKRPSAGRPS